MVVRERSEDRGDPLCPLSVKYLNVAILSFFALKRSIEPENDWSTNIGLRCGCERKETYHDPGVIIEGFKN